MLGIETYHICGIPNTYSLEVGSTRMKCVVQFDIKVISMVVERAELAEVGDWAEGFSEDKQHDRTMRTR